MRKISCAIIGYGRSGKYIHYKILKNNKYIDVKKILDPKNTRINKSKLCKNIFDVASSKIDFVVISSPTKTHYNYSKIIINSGKSVVIEKPICSNVKEINHLYKIAKKRRVKIFPFFNFRYATDYQFIKSIIEKKTLGDIYYVKKRVSYFNIRDDWQSQKKNLGGIENAVLIHHIDQILNLFGSNYKILNVFKKKLISKGNANDFIKVIFRINKIIFELEASWCSAQDNKSNYWEIDGKKGSLWSLKKNNLYLKYFKNTKKIQKKEKDYSGSEKPLWIKKNFQLKEDQNSTIYKYIYNSIINNKRYFVTQKQMIVLQNFLDEIKKY